MPGVEKDDRGGDQFIIGQKLALMLRMDHVAEQIVLRFGPALGITLRT